MKKYTKNFICTSCKCKDFEKLYNFSIDFKNVNFSDEIVYEKKVDDIFICKDCGMRYSPKFIQEHIKEIINKYKNDEWGN